jgi:hypothetical protein
MSRAAVFPLLAVLALSGCTTGPGGGIGGGGIGGGGIGGGGIGGGMSSGAVGPGVVASGRPANLERQQACRQRVNEMYERRDRAEIYRPAAAVNTPFSSNYEFGDMSRGLAGQFGYERTRLECEHNTSVDAAPPVLPPASPRGR